MHLQKKGLRALGIAEIYSGRDFSTLAGVVMRKDLRIDGFVFGRATIGGTDATDAVLCMVRDLDRKNINVILLSGCVIAWYNIIDPERICRETKIPVICITYEESEGLIDDIRKHFPGDDARLGAYLRLGNRVPVQLHTGPIIYLRAAGISDADAARFCNDFTHDGKVPEPLRVARLCARQVPHAPPSPVD
jgi:endonuclease V-like protein UPF0215 family